MQFKFVNLVLVFVGGGLGSVIRYALNILMGNQPMRFPYATLTANVIGCFLIGLFAAYLNKQSQQSLYLLLAVGFCGGFTTFSTFSNEIFGMIKQQQIYLPLAYLFVSVFAGLAATLIGYSLVSK